MAEEKTVTHDDKRKMIMEVMESTYWLTFETKHEGKIRRLMSSINMHVKFLMEIYTE